MHDHLGEPIAGGRRKCARACIGRCGCTMAMLNNKARVLYAQLDLRQNALDKTSDDLHALESHIVGLRVDKRLVLLSSARTVIAR